jgi:hypothetical protein
MASLREAASPLSGADIAARTDLHITRHDSTSMLVVDGLAERAPSIELGYFDEESPSSASRAMAACA